jgi:divalent metal cation (Fe/Co/Zn/Cd) transporter
MRVLLDASVSYDTLEKVLSLVQSEPAVNAISNLTARNSGRYIFVEATVTMRIADLAKAHQISERIEKKIKEAVPNVDRVLIHYEPQKKNRLRYAVSLSNREGQISEEFGMSSYFALVEVFSIGV